jgi:ribosomal protein L30E
MNIKLSIIILAITCSLNINAQQSYRTVKGIKSNYSLTIPSNYNKKETIGTNVDLKFVNQEGASIIIIVKNIPNTNSKNDITQMNNISNEEFVNELSFGGTEEVEILKRNFTLINNVNSFILDYKDSELYTHSVMQYRNGKSILLIYSCPVNKKSTYLPYIYKVSNSLK